MGFIIIFLIPNFSSYLLLKMIYNVKYLYKRNYRNKLCNQNKLFFIFIMKTTKVIHNKIEIYYDYLYGLFVLSLIASLPHIFQL